MTIKICKETYVFTPVSSSFCYLRAEPMPGSISNDSARLIKAVSIPSARLIDQPKPTK